MQRKTTFSRTVCVVLVMCTLQEVLSSVLTPRDVSYTETGEPPWMAGPAFPRGSDCGHNISCYGQCTGHNCDFLATWYTADQSLVFTIKTVFSNGSDVWMAIGFGGGPDMNEASVSECVANSGQVKTFMSYNKNYDNTRVTPDPSIGLSNVTGKLEDGVFTCTFQRLLVVEGGSQVFNLTTSKYHVMLAKGQANGWEIKKHGTAFVTTDNYNLTVAADIEPSPDITTVAPTTAPSGSGFPRDPSCGQNMSCYGHCDGATCDFLATWYEDNQSLVVTLKSVFSSETDVWMAIGFGKEDDMDVASVSECVANSGQVKAYMSYNDNYDNTRVTPDPSTGLSNVTGRLEDGVFTCTFRRLLVVGGGSQVFNLTSEKYHVLLARGKANGWMKTQHSSDDTNRSVTSATFNVTMVTDIDPNVTTTVGPTTTGKPSAKFSKDSECGKTKSCYGNCRDDGCDFLSTWYKSDQSLVISLKSTFIASDEVWMAIAFGTAAKMGPASVSQCVVSSGQVQAFMSYNNGHKNQKVTPDSSIGLSNVTGRLEDGVFTCTFRRLLVVGGGSQVFNLTSQKYHVLLGRGKANGWVIRPHAAADDYVTKSSYDLTDVQDIDTTPQDSTLVKLHGCLMTLAWILSASVGVIVARFYKDTWLTQEVCGVKVWFAVHRSAMVVACVATLAGFVVIFVDVQGLSEILGPDYQKAHPILGIVVTALTILNPVMSLFRCSPTHEHRPLFNWAHWAVGTSAYVVGVTTVGIGTTMFRAQTPDWVTYVVCGFGAWHVLAHTVLEIVKYAESNDSMIGVYRDLQTFSTSYEGMKYQFFRDTVIAMHIVVAIGVCLTIVTAVIGF